MKTSAALILVAGLMVAGCADYESVVAINEQVEAQEKKIAEAEIELRELEAKIFDLQEKSSMAVEQALEAVTRYEALADEIDRMKRAPSAVLQKQDVNAQEIEKLKGENEALRVRLSQILPGESKETIAHDVFAERVTGMTASQVIEFIGQPGNTFGDRDEWWYYHYITHDPVLKKVETSVQIGFKDGIVSSVTPSNH